MLLCDHMAYQWSGADLPLHVAVDVVQVGVGRDASYVLTESGELLGWENDPGASQEILNQVTWFAAGRSGVFATLTDGAFVYMARPNSWFGEGDLVQPEKIGTSIITASIGDSADYFVAEDGSLYVKGNRGKRPGLGTGGSGLGIGVSLNGHIL